MSKDQDGGLGTVPRFPLSPDHEVTLRTLAKNALRQSFELLARERVIPRSMSRPWIELGRDYFGDAVELEGPLSKALEAALPDRFVRQPIDLTMDYPWGYGHALLEAAVAAATFAAEPCSVSSPSVQRVVDEFIDKVQAAPATTLLQVVTDIDVETSRDGENKRTSTGETLRVAEVDIIHVGGNAETYIEKEIRSGGYEVQRGNVVSWPGTASLLVSRVAEASSFDARARKVRRRLQNVLTALRLATGVSAFPLVTIEGEPGNVRQRHPQIQAHAPRLMRLAHRPVTLGAGEVAGLEALCGRVDEWLGGDDLETNPLMLAIGRLNRSMDGPSTTVADIVIDLSVGLEATLSGIDTSDVSLRLRVRAADLLASHDDPGEIIYDDVKRLYELRSAIIHGRILTSSSLRRMIGRVSSVENTSNPGEQFELALDRWRDLLRRAILARAALAAEDLLWPLAESVDVDRELRSPSRRDAWLAHIGAYWADVGLARALAPVPPLQLTRSPGPVHSSDDP